MQSSKCDFRNASLRPISSKCDFLRAPSSKCDFRASGSSKCDFRNLEFRAAASSKCDWRLNLGSLAARGLTNRLQSLDVTLAARRLRVASDKCDYRVTLSDARRTARPATSAAIRADKCDFNVAVLGTSGSRSALGRISTRMASDKCDFRLDLEFGAKINPIFRVSAVASSKCDFRIQELEIRESGGNWRKVDLPGGGKAK